MKITYKDAGVDISEGNKSVDLIKEKVKATYTKGVVGDLGLFAGGFSIKEYMHMEDPILVASTDGVGTKLMVAQEMDKHDTIGIDLVAMCVNDLICMGAKPLFFLDYIATGKNNSRENCRNRWLDCRWLQGIGLCTHRRRNRRDARTICDRGL